MNNGRFKVFDAVRNAYIFVGREWPYLLKIGLAPMALQVCLSLFIEFTQADASAVAGYLWGLPATMSFAWFMFLETRLLLLGERIDRLPADPAYLADFQRAMQLSVLSSLLFNMAMAGAVMLEMTLLRATQKGVSGFADLGGFVLIGAIFWGLRFGIIPILMAVRHPVRPVLRQVQGMLFSLRLAGLGVVCLFPVAFLYQIVILLLLGDVVDPALEVSLTSAQKVALTLAGAPFSLLVSALLNAATVYALKQVLAERRAA